MSEFWQETNDWISAHQALVVAVGVPILTAFAAAIVSWVTAKANLTAQRRERALQQQLKLADFRQRWIDELRGDLALFHSFQFELDEVKKQESFNRFTEIGSRILLRMNRDDTDYADLSKYLQHSILANSRDPAQRNTAASE